MFTVAKDTSWVWPVRVRFPTDDGHKTGEFRARFRLLDDAELESAKTAADPMRFMMGCAVQELLDIQGEDKQPIRHSPELLQQLLAIPYVKLGIGAAYVESVTAAPEKN